MVKLIPYLSVKSAVEAIELYSKIFSAELIDRMPVEKEQATSFGLPDDVDLSQTTMHASLKIGEELMMMSDNFSGEVLEKTNVSILLEPDTLDQMKEFYGNAEKNGCEITMKFEKQFWGDYFCSFKDPFGISWQMNFTPAKDE